MLHSSCDSAQTGPANQRDPAQDHRLRGPSLFVSHMLQGKHISSIQIMVVQPTSSPGRLATKKVRAPDQESNDIQRGKASGAYRRQRSMYCYFTVDCIG